MLEENGSYYPAAIYLGGSEQTVVRSIDSDVVSLFGFAEASSAGVVAGAGLVNVVESTNGTPASGSLRVIIEPAAARLVGAGWRINALANYGASGATLDNLTPGVYSIQLSALSCSGIRAA